MQLVAESSTFHFTLSRAHSSERKLVAIFRTCEHTISLLALPAGTTSRVVISRDRWQRRSQDFCLGGATRYIFRHLSESGEPTAFSGGGGVVAEIFRELIYRIRFSGGGGVVAEIFHVHESVAFPRLRHIFGTFSGHRRVTRRLFTTLTGIKAHFPGLLINSFQKKTFTKSLGGAMASLAPPPGYATDRWGNRGSPASINFPISPQKVSNRPLT